MTGSSLPASASAVRSRPYFSSAWYVPSGSCDVTFCPPRTSWSASSSASRGTTSSASRRCSTEAYSSPRARISSKALSSTRRNARRGLRLRGAARDRGLVPHACLCLGAQLRGAVARAIDERSRQVLLEQRDRQVIRRELGIAQPARKLLRARDRLLRLECQLVEVHYRLLAGVSRRPIDDELAPVRAVNLGDLGAELALHSFHPRARSIELVLQAQHLLDPGEVEPELGRQPLDEPQPLEVLLGVEPSAARGSPGSHETPGLVQPQRLRVHADELGGDGDHVARAIHQTDLDEALTRVLARHLLVALERLFLGLRELLGDRHLHAGEQVATALALQLRRTATLDAEQLSALRPGRDLQRHRAVRGRDLDRAPSAASANVTGTSRTRSAPRRS